MKTVGPGLTVNGQGRVTALKVRTSTFRPWDIGESPAEQRD
jgi:hypothetical protein